MQSKNRTPVDVESIAKLLIRTVGEVEVERIARECGLPPPTVAHGSMLRRFRSADAAN